MKRHHDGRAPTLDLAAIKKTIERALAAAGLGAGHGASDLIHRTLASVGLADAPAAPMAKGVEPAADRGATVPSPARVDEAPAARGGTGRFEAHVFHHAAGTRAYKLYRPAPEAQAPRPLLVMLHGCTQSADDFAAGTRMNRLADDLGWLVLYPEQAAQANPSKCWNWFRSQDQRRDGGEASLIVGLVREVAARHGVDPRRIFVAGLSAGAAMAVLLGETHPELFSGVGAHSGLAYGSARDVTSAMAAMKGGRSGLAGLRGAAAAAGAARSKAVNAVPTIVFHGDRDHTVHGSNADEIVAHAVEAHAAAGAGLRARSERRGLDGGRPHSVTVYTDAQGRSPVESWTLHGAGHAWSGGDPSGSYTDPRGPDASAEMLRFFLALPRAGSA